MKAMILTEDADNFIMVVFYPLAFCLTNDEIAVRIPIKLCPDLTHCKELCPLKYRCETIGLDMICGELGQNFLGFNYYFDIPEKYYKSLYIALISIRDFPRRGVLFKSRRIFKRRKEK